ncbi:efflux RND transporter periplasmic adaptor subunit [Bacillaceae bacterium]
MSGKRVLYLILILILIIPVGGGTGYHYWYKYTHYVETEDARIAGDIYRVIPRIPGKITSLQMSEGDKVVANQIVGELDNSNLTADLLEHALLRAPINGTVIKVMAKEGEVVSPGQPVAMIVNKDALYISANIEETDLQKIRIGQKVEFTVDAFPGYTLTGKVSEIGEATASTFSLLPDVNTSGTFTKITQRIPIKVTIDHQQGLHLSPGMSAVIKIHVKGN